MMASLAADTVREPQGDVYHTIGARNLQGGVLHIVCALACALAALAFAGPGFAADRKPQAGRKQVEAEQVRADDAGRRVPLEQRQVEGTERQRAESGRQRLKALGYELLKPFRDCLDCPEMVVIPSGDFEMGSPAGEVGRYGTEAPQHRVTIAAAFALGKTEVTQGQWRALMGHNPSYFSRCGEECPVEQVSWNDVQEYLLRLSRKTGQRYRLPTEAEWEYAARAGTTTPFNTGNCIDTDQANYDGNFDYNFCRGMKRNYVQRTTPVGSFAANSFALHDMHGNVWEWVEDCWHDDYVGAPSDGSAWSNGPCEKRVLRGGSWKVEPRSLRSAERNWEWAHDPGNGHGFRVARTIFW